MRRLSLWIGRNPMAVLLAAIVLVILLCQYTRRPVDLLRDTRITWTDTTHLFLAALTDDGAERPRTHRYRAQLCAVCDDSLWQPIAHTVWLYIARDSLREAPRRGDSLLVRTRVVHDQQLGTFPYGLYLRRRGITGTAYVSSRNYCLLNPNHPPVAPHGLEALRARLVARYRQLGITGSRLGTVCALTLGIREELDPTVKQAFQNAGAMHVLAVSGLHTGILYTVLLTLLTIGKRFTPLYEERLWQLILSATLITLLWGYAALTDMTPSVVRCVIMFTLFQLGLLLRRSAVSLNTLFAAAALILIIRPNDLFSVSFQLSFCAMTAILLIGLPLHKGLMNLFHVSGYLHWLLNYVIGIITLSIAAWLGTLPVTMYYFGQMSNAFLLANLPIMPLALFLMIFSLATLTLGWLPFLGAPLAAISGGLAELLNSTVLFIESLPHSVTATSVTLPMTLLLYGALLSALLALRHHMAWLAPAAACAVTFCILWIL